MKPARVLGLTLMLAAASVFAEGSTTPETGSGPVSRLWHDTQGRTVQATFRGIENDMVLLETANGSVSQVPLSHLTPEDQQVAKGIKLTVSRVWHTKDGGTVVATFRGVENGKVYLQTENGVVAPVDMDRLSPEDQEMAAKLKPEGLGIQRDWQLAAYAQKIDEIVDKGLAAHGETHNALANDEQFVRRVYLDLVGRIPTREETMAFLADKSQSKRANVIDKLVSSDGFTSHMFDYFADMLRMSDDAQKAKFFTYEEWFKGQLASNRPYNEIVYDMMTADGKLLDNGATGYLLRDKGMRLDNLSLTLSTFLGANVACAQCHDHPFADWTQRQFYQMAAFFGNTETYEKKGGKGAGALLAGKGMKSELTQQEQKKLRRLTQVNQLNVHETGHNDVALPDDYRYKDGKAGDVIGPKLIKWDAKNDVQKYDFAAAPAVLAKFQRTRDDIYGQVEAATAGKKGAENPREVFAKWMTSPSNPRFAMTISNRLWKLVFGVGVKEPINDLDDPMSSNNPVLLGHLANEMVRLKFDLRAYMRLLCNTQTYQREAITKMVTPGEPYYFPGPILRRMSAEQAWDSCVTLAVGEKVDAFKLHRASNYVAATELKAGMSASQIKEMLEMRGGRGESVVGTGAGNGKGKGGAGKGRKMADTEEDEVDQNHPEVLRGQILARASELPQPEKDQHFLRMFGQSDRQIADSGADEGSIPQVLMLMNGEAQDVLRYNKSRVLATALDQKTREDQITSLYVSFFSRHPSTQEMTDAKESIVNGLTIADLTWVLFNSREFVFVQ